MRRPDRKREQMKEYTIDDLAQWLAGKPGRSSGFRVFRGGFEVRLTGLIQGPYREFYGQSKSLNEAVHLAFGEVRKAENLRVFGARRVWLREDAS
mgnify:CR=1 FL=1